MKFSIQVSHYRQPGDGEPAIEIAQRAEELGYEAVWVSDRIVDPEITEAVYPNGGKGVVRSVGPKGAIVDPFIILAMIGARTTRIRLGLSVLVVPYRHPLEAANQFASLDALTGGRVIAGVGAGWHVQEFAALGVPFAERGRRTDEGIDIFQRVWSGEATEFRGKHYSFDKVTMLPRPLQPNGPEIWVGGHSKAARRRTAERGDAWFPSSITPDGYRAGIEEIRRDAAAAGRRDPIGGFIRRIKFSETPGENLYDAYGLLEATPDQVTEVIRAYHAAGVEHLKIDIGRGGETPQATTVLMERFARDIMPVFAGNAA